MNLFNRFLFKSYLILASIWFIVGGFYFIFILSGYHKNLKTAFLGILVGLGILLFSFIHKKVSNNTFGTLRGKLLIISSTINILILVFFVFSALYIVISGINWGERWLGPILFFIMPPLVIIFSFITFLLAVTLHVNKKVAFWIFLSSIIVAAIFYSTMIYSITYLN